MGVGWMRGGCTFVDFLQIQCSPLKSALFKLTIWLRRGDSLSPASCILYLHKNFLALLTSSIKSEPTWLQHGEVEFQARKKHFICISIDRTQWSLHMKILAHSLHFQANEHLFFLLLFPGFLLSGSLISSAKHMGLILKNRHKSRSHCPKTKERTETERQNMGSNPQHLTTQPCTTSTW